MTDTSAGALPDENAERAAGKKSSKLPLVAGLILAVAGGGGGFTATQMGLLDGLMGGKVAEPAGHAEPDPLAPVAFVVLDPVVIALPGSNGRDHLRFTAQLEVPPDQFDAVEAIKPRIVDVLNGYLRAVDVRDMEDPSSLMRLRAQMLRRIEVVAGQGRVTDLLIMEFVLN
ncbi:flagellar basal body-associated FliL family protein [Roseisalinus antarcticus]|uniref:Flagellar protein FliL n=1 Tax=Roseisalinus antarcticus TaxID=254357 RepID=A0A1Y5TYC3_9RHOB|nr:flagellar basal body-associated FliL family protein [Roseisalinus antarcticus]SLN76554.1 Flagellar FliL protein [Roseisalinus antarcticus]